MRWWRRWADDGGVPVEPGGGRARASTDEQEKGGLSTGPAAASEKKSKRERGKEHLIARRKRRRLKSTTTIAWCRVTRETESRRSESADLGGNEKECVASPCFSSLSPSLEEGRLVPRPSSLVQGRQGITVERARTSLYLSRLCSFVRRPRQQVLLCPIATPHILAPPSLSLCSRSLPPCLVAKGEPGDPIISPEIKPTNPVKTPNDQFLK